MRCSGCGKTVPFGGEACAYCLRDKSSDQATTVAGTIAMIVGGFIGNLIAGFSGMIVGAVVLGMIVVVMSMSGKNHSAKKPLRVRTEPAPSEAVEVSGQP